MMQADLTFRGMDPTDAIEAHVAKNIKKFKKYLGKEDPDATFIHIVLEGNHNHDIYKVEIRVKTPNFDLIASREGKDMYPLIDETVHVMDRELERAKTKLIDSVQKPR